MSLISKIQSYSSKLTLGLIPKPKSIANTVAQIEHELNLQNADLIQCTQLLRKYIEEHTEESEKAYEKAEQEGNPKASKLRKKWLRTRQHTLEELMPQAFAIVQEGIRRIKTTSNDHYWKGFEDAAHPEQLMAAEALSNNQIAEQATGEGKTLSAVFAAYLKGMDGHKVHIVTPNEYLAVRDSIRMAPLFRLLGLTTGAIQESMIESAKKDHYRADILYASNSQLAFDFMQDSMRPRSKRFRQPALTAIIDEVDDILLNKAKDPHIIGRPADKDCKIYKILNDIFTDEDGNFALTEAFQLPKKERNNSQYPWEQYSGDVIINKETGSVSFTDEGIQKVCTKLNEWIRNLDEKGKAFPLDFFDTTFAFDTTFTQEIEYNIPAEHEIRNLVKAYFLFQIDRDYIVKRQELCFKPNDKGIPVPVLEDKVRVIDAHTKRVAQKTRWSEGLHSAVEAKEGVPINRENENMDMITFQNYFLTQYTNLAGMTGTAYTDRREFSEVYGLEVVQIPTHEKCIRKDEGYRLYKGLEDAIQGAIKDAVEKHKEGRPVLIVAPSDGMAEYIHTQVKAFCPDAEILSAKETYQHQKKEAEITEHAGEHGKVTASTPMAGRGIDIKLDPKAKEAGGLHIVGVCLPEFERNEKQVIGRSGRQGDPGSSVYHIAMVGDPTIDKYTPPDSKRHKTFQKAIKGMEKQKTEYLQHPILTKQLHKLQRKIGDYNYGIRLKVLENEHSQAVFMNLFRYLGDIWMHDSDGVMLEQILDLYDSEVQEQIKEGDIEGGRDPWYKIHKRLYKMFPGLPIPDPDRQQVKNNKARSLESLSEELGIFNNNGRAVNTQTETSAKRDYDSWVGKIKDVYREFWSSLTLEQQQEIRIGALSKLRNTIPIYLQEAEKAENMFYHIDRKVGVFMAKSRIATALLGEIATKVISSIYNQLEYSILPANAPDDIRYTTKLKQMALTSDSTYRKADSEKAK